MRSLNGRRSLHTAGRGGNKGGRGEGTREGTREGGREGGRREGEGRRGNNGVPAEHKHLSVDVPHSL